MTERTYVLLGIFLLAVFFNSTPEIDLWAAGIFYRGEQGFFLRHHPAIMFVYRAVPVITVIVALGGSLLILINTLSVRLTKRGGPIFLSNRILLYLLLTLALGPGLLSATLQEGWGRARPREVIEFGGTKLFSPVLTLSDQCDDNCSFISSHASVGFFFLTLSFLTRRYRKSVITASLLLGVMVSFARVAQGAHFLSDVIFAAVLTYGVAYLLYLLLIHGRLQES